MVDKRECTFCGKPIEPGTGKLYVKKDGTKLWFDTLKCQKNMVQLRRVSRTVKWTTHYTKGLAPVAAPKPEPAPAPAAPEPAAAPAPAKE